MLNASPSLHLPPQLRALVSPADQSHLHLVYLQSATVFRSGIHARLLPDGPLVCMAFRPFSLLAHLVPSQPVSVSEPTEFWDSKV